MTEMPTIKKITKSKLIHLPSSVSQKAILIAVIGVVSIALISGGAFFFYKNQAKSPKTKKGQLVTGAEAKSLIAKVEKLIELPQGETPTIATVENRNDLAKQTFFARSKNGDKVLVYQGAKKAFLYRPSTNRIIEVGTVTISQTDPRQPKVAGAQSASNESAPTTTPSNSEPTGSQSVKDVKVVLWNGTSVVGLTHKIEERIRQEIPDVNVVDKDNSKRKDYDKTMVIYLEDKSFSYAERLAKILNGKVEKSLPADETTPSEGDIIVIIGQTEAGQ